MTFVLTNDDGIDAPGIRALEKAFAQTKLETAAKGSTELCRSAVIIAPQDHQSGCGHQVTTTRAIPVDQRSETAFAIGGTPADCTRLALTHLCPEASWVLSGINAGGNLGSDVYISGTVAAVREAVLLGVPGIAVSHYRKGKLNVDWETAARWTAKVLTDLLSRPWEAGTFWNVNLPHLLPGDPDPEIVFCPPSTQPLPVEYRVEGQNFYYVGNYQQRDRAPGTDVAVCFSGKIAVTQLRL